METTTHNAVCVYGAQIIAKHLGAMSKEIEGVIEAKDIEYIHRMRVASRRMRSAITLFQGCFVKQDYKRIIKQMRKITRALGEARDLDVQIASLDELGKEFQRLPLEPGIRRLKLRLQQRRQKAQKHVDAAMEAMKTENVLENLIGLLTPMLAAKSEVYLFSPSLYQLAFRGIKEKLDALLLHVPYIHNPDNKLELHAMRISAKRLRYTLESFENLYGDKLKPYINHMRELQDLLGSIHDLDVWDEFIPAFIEEERQRILDYFGNLRPLRRLLPGLEALQLKKLQKRKLVYSEFLTLWDDLETKKVGEKLLELINTPIDLDAALKKLMEERINEQQKTEQST